MKDYKYFYTISKDRAAFGCICAESFYLAYNAVTDEIKENFSIFFEVADNRFPSEIFPRRWAVSKLVAVRQFADGHKTLYIIDSHKEQIFTSCGSETVGGDYFWIYELSGLHEGEPIKIAVKNPRADWDSMGGVYSEHDGLYWADDLTDNGEFDDTIIEFYEKFFDALKDDVCEVEADRHEVCYP